MVVLRLLQLLPLLIISTDGWPLSWPYHKIGYSHRGLRHLQDSIFQSIPIFQLYNIPYTDVTVLLKSLLEEDRYTDVIINQIIFPKTPTLFDDEFFSGFSLNELNGLGKIKDGIKNNNDGDYYTKDINNHSGENSQSNIRDEVSDIHENQKNKMSPIKKTKPDINDDEKVDIDPRKEKKNVKKE